MNIQAWTHDSVKGFLPSCDQPKFVNICQKVRFYFGRTIYQFFTIGVSVRLSERTLHREEKNKIHQKLPQWGLKPGPLDHEANALPTELSQHSLSSLNLHGLYKVMLY